MCFRSGPVPIGRLALLPDLSVRSVWGPAFWLAFFRQSAFARALCRHMWRCAASGRCCRMPAMRQGLSGGAPERADFARDATPGKFMETRLAASPADTGAPRVTRPGSPGFSGAYARTLRAIGYFRGLHGRSLRHAGWAHWFGPRRPLPGRLGQTPRHGRCGGREAGFRPRRAGVREGSRHARGRPYGCVVGGKSRVSRATSSLRESQRARQLPAIMALTLPSRVSPPYLASVRMPTTGVPRAQA